MILDRACPDCSKPAVFNFHEKIVYDGLFWSASFTCSACGYEVEIDDRGSLPDDLRSRIIAEEGLWELEISSKGVYTLKAIRQIIPIPVDELAELKKQIPFAVYQGTQTEVNFYFNQMLKLVPDMKIAMRKAD